MTSSRCEREREKPHDPEIKEEISTTILELARAKRDGGGRSEGYYNLIASVGEKTESRSSSVSLFD